ncbi:MAG: hypothetical protein IT265_06325 [Saprospiraceae bacterium]|nr:hypothetical protein [Saprospiraceae bacterium]
MRKDIFIDNNIASKFSNPQDKEYIKLTEWLIFYDEKDTHNKDKYAHLVVSKKLLVEYSRSALNAKSDTSIPSIVDKLLREDRLIIVSNQQIKDFQTVHYSKAVLRKLRSNIEDREHLPLVLLSDRKFVLSYDDNFTYDLLNFAGFTVLVKKRPEEIPYK